MDQQLEVIQEDNDILVCRKPAGIPVQTSKLGQEDMVSLLKNYRAGRGERAQIFVVHRLDQPVEGIMVFAKNQRAASSLSRQMQQRSIDKCYYALVEGVPQSAQGTAEDYLLRDGKNNMSSVVSPDTKGARRAVLHYQVLQVKEDRSLMKIVLETGRHHQIRVQMAHMGHPLVGDKKYNSQCPAGYQPIGLCSVGLAFLHPFDNKKLEFWIEPRGEAFENFKRE